jgi:hypothetical protein
MTTRKSPPVGPYCLAAEALSVPEAHGRCRGAGPRYLPSTPPGGAAVLARSACGCTCHQAARGRAPLIGRRDGAPILPERPA